MAPRGTRGLGKGLDSLIPSNVVKDSKEKRPIEGEPGKEKPDSIVDINKIEPNREQPRKLFDEEALTELADSIKQFGLLQPILVQDRKTYYEIIAGERRWRASKLAGLKEVPVIIRNYSEQEIVEISLIENIQREDLNPIEEAQAYKRLLTEFNLKQEEVAERVSKSRSAVTNSMRLLKLGDKVQEMVINGELSTGHARALLAIEDLDKQLELAKKIVAEKWSVRDIEKYMQSKPKQGKSKSKEEKSVDLIFQEKEEELRNALGTKISISPKSNGSGKIEIEYYSIDDFDRLMDILTK